MTANINNQTATATATEEFITLKVNGTTVKFPLAAATSVVTATLAARKEGIEIGRKARQAANAVKVAERQAAKVAREKTAAEKKAATLAKLEAKLAKLKAA